MSEELDAILATLRGTKHEATDNQDGTYTHVFTPPGMTMEDVAKLLARIPDKEENED